MASTAVFVMLSLVSQLMQLAARKLRSCRLSLIDGGSPRLSAAVGAPKAIVCQMGPSCEGDVGRRCLRRNSTRACACSGALRTISSHGGRGITREAKSQCHLHI